MADYYEPVFKRVMVDCVIQGGSRISWELNSHFIDPGPYTFQLQVGHTAVDAADDWVNIGAPVINGYFTFDLSKEVWGKTQETHYRLVLTTPVDTYVSPAADCSGNLIKRDWIKAREIIRKENLMAITFTSPDGFLLKARRYGPKCTYCSDQFTEEVSQTNCPVCYGTGFLNGYFDPMPASFADVGTDQNREHRDAGRGMVKEDTIQARFIGDPQLYTYDVWVNKTSDERYYLQTIVVKAQVRGVPIIYDAELRLAPFTDVVYTVPIDTGNLPSDIARKTWQRKIKPNLNYMDLARREVLARQRTR